MRAILVLYFKNHFGYSDSRSTVLYHVFIMLSYMTSVFGGLLADSGLGKYRTILYLSCVYCAGSLVLASTSARGATGEPPSAWGAFLGLLLIAIGTGGIKPCVAAFGGDQYTTKQAYLLPVSLATPLWTLPVNIFSHPLELLCAVDTY